MQAKRLWRCLHHSLFQQMKLVCFPVRHSVMDSSVLVFGSLMIHSELRLMSREWCHITHQVATSTHWHWQWMLQKLWTTQGSSANTKSTAICMALLAVIQFFSSSYQVWIKRKVISVLATSSGSLHRAPGIWTSQHATQNISYNAIFNFNLLLFACVWACRFTDII